MQKRFFLIAMLVGFWCGMTTAQEVDFTKQVHPVLKKYCAGCHNEDDREGDFSVDSYEAIQESEGTAYEPGSSSESLMIQMMLGEVEPVMPPEDQARPDSEDIELVASWIDAGAKGPKKAKPSPTKKSMERRNKSPDFPKIAPAIKPESKSITCADWSAQGLIAIGTFRSVTILDAQDLSVLKRLDDFPGKVNSVRFSADGKRLIVASGIVGVSGEASVWDTTTGKQIRRLEGHSDTIYQAMESPDGQWIATCSYDKKVLLWSRATGKLVRTLTGHNDAIYDLHFHPQSNHLITASGDQTAKIWNLKTGERLDTLGQPLKEQFTARFHPKGNQMISAGRDNRIRVWRFESRDSAKTNPLVFARFAHEAPIVRMEFDQTGQLLFTSSEDKTIKVWEADSYRQVATFKTQSDICSALAVGKNGKQIFVGRLNGTYEILDTPELIEPVEPTATEFTATLGAAPKNSFNNVAESEPNNEFKDANVIHWPAKIQAVIGVSRTAADYDLFAFDAKQGETVLIETKASRDKSPLDTTISVLTPDGAPVPRVLLRAVRDSYFTFRGKDSNTSDDFRVHNWEEMKLNDFLYANGEVVKLFLHPRGPDSGFKVYPGYGKRHNFFGTTANSHALHEPCYIVRPFPVGTEFQPNGLPVFQLNYENDDAPSRQLGNDSRLFFTPPADGQYLVKVADVRGFGGQDFKYELQIRHPNPGFSVSLSNRKEFHVGSGQELSFTANRIDGFKGPIKIEAENVPESIFLSTPLTIEAGHNKAFGSLHLKSGESVATKEQLAGIRFKAIAEVGGTSIEKAISGINVSEIKDSSKIQLRIVNVETEYETVFESTPDSPLVFEVKPGTKLHAKVVARRLNHSQRIAFGNEDSGRNLPHGVYVSDIGLNGLMITKNKKEQEFFVTIEAWVQPTECTFHVRANNVDGIASWPVILKISN